MNLDSIRAAIKKQPFREFELCLADGRRVAVKHPEFLAMTKRIVIVADDDDTFSILEPLLIVSIEYGKKFAKGGNGSPPGKRKP